MTIKIRIISIGSYISVAPDTAYARATWKTFVLIQVELVNNLGGEVWVRALSVGKVGRGHYPLIVFRDLMPTTYFICRTRVDTPFWLLRM